MSDSEAILGLPDYEISEVERLGKTVTIWARHSGPVSCPHCGGERLRVKGRYLRTLRHESWGMRRVMLRLEGRKRRCLDCGRQFRERFPGILRWQRASEAFRYKIFADHWDGISRHRLSQREGIGSATVERYFQYFLRRLAAERGNTPCPQILGIDEHFFSRRQGYATTFCDLKNHRVFDVVLGRSEAALEGYLQALEGKDLVRLVCMDLSATYRALVRKYLPCARIVADRFHVIRIINYHFLACWRELDPQGAKNRGLLSLMRRHRHNLSPEQSLKLKAYFALHPVVELVYKFKQRLCYLLLKKHRTQKQCRKLARRFLASVQQLRQAGLPHLVQLGETLASWSEEIAAMWRFTRNNGITEGFHTKMEVLQRQAHGFRNFNNYRLRVKVMCS